MDIASLSHSERTILLARIAHALTICARSTYEPGTENIAEPKVLRGYNELMHRVTSSIRGHVEGSQDVSLEIVLRMMQEFGANFDRVDEINWALESAQQRPLL